MSGTGKLVSLRVVELLNSRVCHDLISPVGAVKSGLELLSEFGDDPGGEAMALITSSADSASRKLQFFRMAFGMAGSAQAITHGEAVDLSSAMVVTQRTSLDWPDPGETTSATDMKIILNLLVLAGDGLPRGGVLRVKQGGNYMVEVIAASADAKLGDETKAAALGESDEEELTPRSVQAYLVHLLVNRAGGSLKIEEDSEGNIYFRVLDSANT